MPHELKPALPAAALRAGAACAALSGCSFVEGKVEEARFQVDAATQYNHRGMPNNERGVLQPEMAVSLPTRHAGLLDVSAWGNIDLTDSTGDAWFPDGNQGRFSEIDFTLAWSRAFGPLDTTLGLENYNLLNGQEFASGPAQEPRGPTSELFATASTRLPGIEPFVEVHYDVDEVQDFYLRGGVATGLELTSRLRLEAEVGIGWSGEEASLWSYGLPEQGFADLTATTALLWQWDKRTTLKLGVGASRMVDPTLREWFDLIGIEKDNVWGVVGVGWSF